jgi:hypothetical protein
LIGAVGTIAGMMLITTIIAVLLTYSANGFQSFNRYVAAVSAPLDCALVCFLSIKSGFIYGVFR